MQWASALESGNKASSGTGEKGGHRNHRQGSRSGSIWSCVGSERQSAQLSAEGRKWVYLGASAGQTQGIRGGGSNRLPMWGRKKDCGTARGPLLRGGNRDGT